MTEEEPFDIDTLMSQDPLGLSKLDLDRIIAYQRKLRIQRENGVKTKKTTERAPSKLNVDALLGKIIGPSSGAIKGRRF